MTARLDIPDFMITVGEVVFLAWPVLTLAAAFLRWRGAGPRDWLLWTSLAVILIPAAMVALLVPKG